MRSILYALLLLLGTNPALFAQPISGTVKNTAGTGIANATIQVLNTENTAVTNSSGSFDLKLAAGSYQIQVSAAGYASQLQAVQLSGNPVQLAIVLVDQNQQLSEVVVSATRREESLLQVPVASSSLSSKRIEDTRTWGLQGLTALIPNYTYQELGVAFQQVQSIRGIQVFSENPAVSTYIDDVNNIDILANGFAFTDIERIEVLRGPQSTLFGRNAMGGVINIITKKPTNRITGQAEVSLGNLGLQRYSANFKMPIVRDKLFFGLSALYQKRDGYWTNDTTGTTAPLASANGKTVGGEDNLYGNLYLKWLPSSRFSVTLNLKGQQDKSNSSGFFVSQSDRDEAFANPDKINLARIGKHERNILNSSLVAKYAGSGVQVTSITALQTIGLSYTDIDFPGIFHSFNGTKLGERLPPQRVFSQELRLQSVGQKKISYTAGLYGFTQVGYEPSTNFAFESPMVQGLSLVSRNKSDNAGIAAYGELSYQLDSKWKLTAGLRYDYEKREGIFNGFGDALFAAGEVINVVPDTTVSGSYSALSPKIAISYGFSERSSAYLSYTRGFRAGGVNAQKIPGGGSQTFDPEYSDNMEAGYKFASANRRLTLGLSGFFIHWQDLQFFNLVAPFTVARENVGNAYSAGLELEATAIPVKGLQLEASLGLNQTAMRAFDLKRVNFFTGVESSTPIGGLRLSNAPGHTLFLASQWEQKLGKKWRGIARAELRQIGQFYTDIQNTLSQPRYTLINTRLGVSSEHLSIFFWVQNLGNERFLSFGSADVSFGRGVRTAAPRTFGLTLSTQF